MRGRNTAKDTALSVILGLLSVAWVYPVFMILFNSLKKETSISTGTAFQFPNGESFAGLANYADAINSKGFLSAFWYTLVITITSVVLILICCSMCAWFITRVNAWYSKALYFLFVFSMVVPFQMLMFTLSSTADRIGSGATLGNLAGKLGLSVSSAAAGVSLLPLNTPYGICIIYLGFGAGLAVFMFCGFMKSIPLEVEEAAMIDGCGPLRTFFLVVLPILKPTLISVGILETMWLWNDYLLPYLVLDRTKGYMTIPILIQYFRGSFGKVEMGPMMASIMLNIIPIIIVYLLCQKHIIKGVAAGAVKG